MTDIDRILTAAPVIPVVTLTRTSDARPLAEALLAGGLPVIEVVLRTPEAIPGIAEMAKVPGVIVGVGTVTNGRELAAAATAGAAFAVSPGFTDELVHAARYRRIPLLPGIATASDILRGLEAGYSRFKFFPAEAAGGIPALKALSAPFHKCRFCPTGGITEATAAAWLELPSVLCVGGSWIVPPGSTDYAAIEQRARNAAKLADLKS